MAQGILLGQGSGEVEVELVVQSSPNSVATYTLEKDYKYITMVSTIAIIRDGYNISCSCNNSREMVSEKSSQVDSYGRQSKSLTRVYKNVKAGDRLSMGCGGTAVSNTVYGVN